MNNGERVFTNEDFWKFVSLPRNTQQHFELIDGVIHEMPAASPLHRLISVKFLYFLIAYLMRNEIGYAIGEGHDFILAPGIILKPDAAYIAKTRLPKLSSNFHLSPDIAIKVAASCDTSIEILDRVENYIRYGAKFVWIVCPESRSIYVYRPAEDGSLNLRKLGATDHLEAGEVLPGFSLPVNDLFPEVEVE